jgi:hypothetical protein
MQTTSNSNAMTEATRQSSTVTCLNNQNYKNFAASGTSNFFSPNFEQCNSPDGENLNV